MTTRYTNEEWATFISEFESGLVVSQEPCFVPRIGSVDFANTIDHTLLKLEAKAVQIDALCAEARVGGFATVCVRPQHVARSVTALKGTDVKVASVIDFPSGSHDLLLKLTEAKQCLHAGAQELDVVLNYPELINGDYACIYNELATLRLQAAPPVVLKLIIETSQLDRSQIIAACAMAGAAKFDFVKTSTGFNGQGATEENVRLMATCCDKLALANHDGQKMLVEASGGIRTIDDAVKMLEAGASRLGTSGGVWIVKEGKENVERSQGPVSISERRGSLRPPLATRLFTDF